MALRIYYSDSEEFLMGVSTGIEHTNDGAFEPEPTPQASDHESYEFMLHVEDADADDEERYYYDGASLDYHE
jgi:hypothetical protein